jgi:hypothetical protein
VLGQLLLEAGLLDEGQLERALAAQEESGGKLGSILTRQGAVSETDIAATLEKQLRIPWARLAETDGLGGAANYFDADLALRGRCLPVARTESVMKLAMEDPLDLAVINTVEARYGLRVEPVIATAGELSAAIKRCFGEQTSR